MKYPWNRNWKQIYLGLIKCYIHGDEYMNTEICEIGAPKNEK